MHCLLNEGLNSHPDEDFRNYINMNTDEPSYTEQEAEIRNLLMGQCFEVCESTGTDIYSFMQEIHLKFTGLDKYIPLPSSLES